MGLDISHGAWNGAYSAFHRWRCMIAQTMGFPPLDIMEGFYDDKSDFALLDHKFDKDALEMSALRRIREQLPIKWESLKPSPIIELLYHSDCDGDIPHGKLRKLADALEELLHKIPDTDGGGHIGNYREKTQTFINGCRLAYSKKQKLKFQ